MTTELCLLENIMVMWQNAQTMNLKSTELVKDFLQHFTSYLFTYKPKVNSLSINSFIELYRKTTLLLSLFCKAILKQQTMNVDNLCSILFLDLFIT